MPDPSSHESNSLYFDLLLVFSNHPRYIFISGIVTIKNAVLCPIVLLKYKVSPCLLMTAASNKLCCTSEISLHNRFSKPEKKNGNYKIYCPLLILVFQVTKLCRDQEEKKRLNLMERTFRNVDHGLIREFNVYLGFRPNCHLVMID